MVTQVNARTLRVILENEKGNALVLFKGAWCVDCTAFEPTWNAWTTGRIGPIFAFEIRRGSSDWSDWKLDEIPTVIAYVAGKEKGRAHDVISREDLDRLWALLR